MRPLHHQICRISRKCTSPIKNPDETLPHYSSHTTKPQTNVTMSTAELASSYAALILADDGVDITVR